MAKKWKPKTYTGELAKPLLIDPKKAPPLEQEQNGARVLTTRVQSEYWKKNVRDVVDTKLGLLFTEHGIDVCGSNPWQDLALCLAFAHVPGLSIQLEKPAPRRGAPIKHTSSFMIDFLTAVDAAREEIAAKRNCKTQKVSIADAVRKTVKQDQTKWRGMTPNRYSEFNKKVSGLRYLSLALLDPNYYK